MPISYLESFQDSDFFAHKEMSALGFSMLETPDTSSMVLGGPKHWNPVEHPAFPIIVGIKTHSSLPQGFNPKRRGSLYLANQRTGKLIKVPLAEREKQPSTPAPSGTRPESTTANQRWVDLPKELFEGAPADWIVFGYSGKFISNPLKIHAGTPGLDLQADPSWQALHLAPQTRPDLIFTQLPSSPSLNGQGIQVVVSKEPLILEGRRWNLPLLGSFLVPDDSSFHGQWIPLELLFGADVPNSNHLLELQIPIGLIDRKDGFLSGHFALDLSLLSMDPGSGKFNPPKEWYLTAICKGVIAEPQALTIPVR
jgi:hypothetical protein